jgi:hypothetical protein
MSDYVRQRRVMSFAFCFRADAGLSGIDQTDLHQVSAALKGPCGAALAFVRETRQVGQMAPHSIVEPPLAFPFRIQQQLDRSEPFQAFLDEAAICPRSPKSTASRATARLAFGPK